jgi:multidrug efflux pump subunit AcrA (membrane-fusion protein)
MAVSAANRKICYKCKEDVTFTRRVSDPKGRYLCLVCAKAIETAPIAPSAPSTRPSKEPKSDLELLAQIAPEIQPPFSSVAETKPRVTQNKKLNRQKPFPTEAMLWISGGVAIVLILVGAFFLVNRKTWDQQNHDEILSMKSDADGLLRSGQPKAAYDHYKELFVFVGQHEIQNDFIKSELEAAQTGMDTARAQAAPLIAKEEEEARQRAAEQQRLVDQQRAAALAEKQREENAHRQQELARAQADAEARQRDRIAREAAAQHAMKATARALFLKSDQFADWKRQADNTVSELSTDLIGEDSAYRGLSKRAKASRNLLGLYVKAEGHLLGSNVDSSVDRLLSAADTNLITEDSAIRAIYENDRAFLQVLEPLCVVMDGKSATLQHAFDTESRSATLDGIGDDSAIRAIDSYSKASMQVLLAIVSAQGLGSKADAIVSDVRMQNVGDDSAWRVAMRNENGSMRLLLLLVSQEDPVAAAKIQSDADTSVIGDDSALRAQDAYHQGKIAALHWLVCHP